MHENLAQQISKFILYCFSMCQYFYSHWFFFLKNRLTRFLTFCIDFQFLFFLFQLLEIKVILEFIEQYMRKTITIYIFKQQQTFTIYLQWQGKFLPFYFNLYVRKMKIFSLSVYIKICITYVHTCKIMYFMLYTQI